MNTLPNRELLKVEEVAMYFGVAKSTIYLWIDHGILEAEKYHGTIRIPRESVQNCRIESKLKPLE